MYQSLSRICQKGIFGIPSVLKKHSTVWQQLHIHLSQNKEKSVCVSQATQ